MRCRQRGASLWDSSNMKDFASSPSGGFGVLDTALRDHQIAFLQLHNVILQFRNKDSAVSPVGVTDLDASPLLVRTRTKDAAP